MRIVVLGAGVVGTAAAWWLARDGHEVTVVERHAGPAQGTSYSNAGLVSPGDATAWASPAALKTFVRALYRRDLGIRVKLSLDPGFAPGTGTPEIGGLTTIQALEIIRGCWGLNLVGCDLVEVSPPYDTSGNTALTAAYLLFEMLCVLPGVERRV